MDIKRIKLSPKKGGNGFVSSFSVNLGSVEAKRSGLIKDDGGEKIIVKYIDYEKQEVILKPKKCTLTDDILYQVILQAKKVRDLSRKIEHELYGDAEVINISDIHDLRNNVDNEMVQYHNELENQLYKYLLSLPLETLTDLMTLMYMGRERDADMSMDPKDRFNDYWAYLADGGCFSDGAEAIVSQMMMKVPFPDYLEKGISIMNQPPKESGTDDSDYIDEDFE